ASSQICPLSLHDALPIYDSLSLAPRTRRAERAAHPDFARSSALGTGLRPAAGARAAPFALRAPRGTVHRELALGAEHCFPQVHFDGCLGVVTGHWFRGAAPWPRG